MKKTKFGEIIDSKVPVLIIVYHTSDKLVNSTYNFFTAIPRNIAAYFGDQIKVVKIDEFKNKELAIALKVRYNPTMILYVNGEEKFRFEELRAAKEIIEILTPYITIT